MKKKKLKTLKQNYIKYDLIKNYENIYLNMLQKSIKIGHGKIDP